MMPVKYTFELTGDFAARLAEMSDKNNKIKFNPMTANKADVAVYTMYQLLDSSAQITELTKSVTTVNNTLNTLSTTVGTLSTNVADLTSKVRDLEGAAEAKDREIADLQGQLAEANRKIDAQDTKVDCLEKRVVKCEQGNLELERHSRSSNVRIGGIEETKDENCSDKVLSLLEGMGLGHVDIENCHRVGEKKQGKTRYMIVRFVRRLQRREVIAKRKVFFDNNFPLYEDLPKQDLDTKQKFKAEIDDLYSKDNKCYFSRGAWYVNGKKKFW